MTISFFRSDRKSHTKTMFESSCGGVVAERVPHCRAACHRCCGLHMLLQSLSTVMKGASSVGRFKMRVAVVSTSSSMRAQNSSVCLRDKHSRGVRIFRGRTLATSKQHARPGNPAGAWMVTSWIRGVSFRKALMRGGRVGLTELAQEEGHVVRLEVVPGAQVAASVGTAKWADMSDRDGRAAVMYSSSGKGCDGAPQSEAHAASDQPSRAGNGADQDALSRSPASAGESRCGEQGNRRSVHRASGTALGATGCLVGGSRRVTAKGMQPPSNPNKQVPDWEISEGRKSLAERAR